MLIFKVACAATFTQEGCARICPPAEAQLPLLMAVPPDCPIPAKRCLFIVPAGYPDTLACPAIALPSGSDLKSGSPGLGVA